MKAICLTILVLLLITITTFLVGNFIFTNINDNIMKYVFSFTVAVGSIGFIISVYNLIKLSIDEDNN